LTTGSAAGVLAGAFATDANMTKADATMIATTRIAMNDFKGFPLRVETTGLISCSLFTLVCTVLLPLNSLIPVPDTTPSYENVCTTGGDTGRALERKEYAAWEGVGV
jgi:hypothetical protein